MTNGRIMELVWLRDRTGVFADRTEAGGMLAELVAGEALHSPFVLLIMLQGIRETPG